MRDAPQGDFEPGTELLEAMQAWGAPPEEVDAVRAQLAASAPPADGDAFGVHRDNWPSVSAFRALGTQWVYAGMDGQRVGMDYAGVCAWLAAHVPRPRRRRPLLRDIQAMEHAVLQADQEKRQQEEE